MLTVELEEQTQRALEQRAADHGQSVEAEVRSIVEEAIAARVPSQPVSPEVGLGTLLQDFGRKYGPLPEIERDRRPLVPASFD